MTSKRGALIAAVRSLTALSLLSLAGSCSAVDAAPEPVPCDQACRDAVALRAVREMCKLMYNLTLQGKPVGAQDRTAPCPKGGTVHVFGEATSNASQGATEVKLTYEFAGCGYQQKDSDANKSYDVVVTGAISQEGILSAQSSTTTALIMKSSQMTVTGQVHDPAQAYEADRCYLEMTQNGSHVSGKICGRDAGLDL